MHKSLVFFLLLGVFVFASPEGAPRVFATQYLDAGAVQTNPNGLYLFNSFIDGIVYHPGQIQSVCSVTFQSYWGGAPSISPALVMKIYDRGTNPATSTNNTLLYGSLVGTNDVAQVANVGSYASTTWNFTPCVTTIPSHYYGIGVQTLVATTSSQIILRGNSSNQPSVYSHIGTGTAIGAFGIGAYADGENTCQYLGSEGVCTTYAINADTSNILGATGIYSVVPYNLQFLVATTTSGVMSMTYSVDPADFVSNMVAEMCFQTNNPNSIYDVFGKTCIDKNILAAGGDTWLATTSAQWLDDGTYTLTSSLNKPWFSIFGIPVGNTAVVATTTLFTVKDFTLWDTLHGYADQYNNKFGGTGTTTTAIDASCSIASLALVDCFSYVFIPTPVAFFSLVSLAENGFLSAFPWGYITHTIELMTVASSTLPTVSISAPSVVMGNAFPIHATATIDPFANLPTATGTLFASAVSPDGKTFRQVTENDWNIILGIIWLISVISYISGYSMNTGGVEGRDTGQNVLSVKERYKISSSYKKVGKGIIH